jgi:superfamily II DNA or RNA helicase/HKD family nuclease
MQSGLHEQLLTIALKQGLANLADPRLYSLAPVDPEDSHSALAQFIEHAIANCLSTFRGAEVTDQQVRLANRLIEVLAADGLSLATPLQRLLAVHSVPEEILDRPDTPLSRSALLTGTRLDPSLGSQLRKEIATADRVDILCSFIKWSGLRIILDELKKLSDESTGNSPRIRVITTSYMGATDPRAVDELSKLLNTEIRVSYDTKRTRLHAKAYVFHRNTGFGTAYIGSANLSNAALSEGLEWTTKISHYELPYLWSKIAGTFETYWQDEEFQPYSPDAPERLRQAIQRERATGEEDRSPVHFDLKPFPFQEEILDVLSAEREVQDLTRHLVVAATGTGKTMIAAFDYARFCRHADERPSMLFVVHREEILRQAIATFRGVLRDQNFGDLLVGGQVPTNSQHLFCSIQSYNAQELWQCPADRFDYVVVDEFHHAAAPSYRRLLDHIRPRILLGLTATPERSDQLDILQWFGGRTSAEIRLPDAINRRLLCPFQYFGVADSVDLDGLNWQRGGYRVEDLDRVYTGNDIRAALVLEKVHEIVLNPHRARGLAFCVSVAHAEFMSRFFNEHGLPSMALSGQSPDDLRFAAKDRLRAREINFIFVVDLYNEGVDLPEVDTLLFLRPTESLTMFLQQLGRGLRLHQEKECLTVLDFVGAQRREFRFAPRFRAISAKPTARIDVEIEHGFPHLPAGCVVQLERIAQQRILENVRESVRLLRPKMIANLRQLGQYLSRTPTIGEALEFLDTSLDELLKRGLWSQLLADAGLGPPSQGPDCERLAKGILRICHLDDVGMIRCLQEYLKSSQLHVDSDTQRRRLEMAHVSLWGSQSTGWSLEEADARLRRNPSAWHDLFAVMEFRLSQSGVQHHEATPLSAPLSVHSQYTRDEILVGLGHWALDRRPDQREGVLHLAEKRVDVFFVTLQKTEEDYSPTTMYEDYLISHDRFHWQSQSGTSVESKTGQRYIHHREFGYTPLLFVRETRTLSSGLTSPYVFLGPCEYVSHEGTRPISITWKLQYKVPARLFRVMARQSAG